MIKKRKRKKKDPLTTEAAETFRRHTVKGRVQVVPDMPAPGPKQGTNLLESPMGPPPKNQTVRQHKLARLGEVARPTETSGRVVNRRVRKTSLTSIHVKPHVVQKINTPSSVALIHPLLPDLDPSNIEVSIVLGTYNRLKLLQACVESVRIAAKHISYEIVITDGGSTDGSAEWLQQQTDIVYVAGELSGAVPAFNAAAKVARGQFILALNDDATLHPEAVEKGLTYFKDPMVGQVAFSFLEYGKWKIERVHDHIYANFALTRTNIVRAVEHLVGGMWAVCYRTYGGDTELSCWVHRLGYKVVGATDAKVEHREFVDSLRHKNVQVDHQRNNFHRRWKDASPLRFRGPSPDVSEGEVKRLKILEAGESVVIRWPRIAAADPQIGQLPPRVPLKPERVLHWQLWTADDPQTSMVHGLRKLGSAGHLCIPWTSLNIVERGREFVEAVNSFRPTVVFLQCQDPEAIPTEALKMIRQDPTRDPSLVVCVWSGDIGPNKGPWSGSNDEWQYHIAPHVDLMLFTGTGCVDHHRARGMRNAAYLQIGYDVDRYFAGPDEHYGSKHAVTFLGQDYGPQFNGVPGSEAGLRRQVVQALRAVKGFVPYGSGFGPGVPQAQTGDLYRKSAMALSISLTSNLARYSSDRLLRAMACGCPTLVKRFSDMAGMGLVDGINCLGWNTPEEAVAAARAWLVPERRAELREIGKAGAKLMLDHHTWDVRMGELTALLNTVRKQR